MIVAMVLLVALILISACLTGAVLCWQISERRRFGKQVQAKETAQAQRMPTSFNVVPDTSQLPSIPLDFDDLAGTPWARERDDTILSMPYTDDHAPPQAETTSQSDFDAISDGGHDGGDCGGCDGGDD